MKRIVVLVSGRGSNLRSLAAAMREGRCAGTLAGVVTDRAGCDALAFAKELNLATAVVRQRDFEDRAAWDEALAGAIALLDADLVVLAGFMRIVGPAVLRRFGGRIVNVHPSLLPSFPGLHAPRQAIDAGARITGCTVHLVDAGVDSGPILAQGALPVRPGDDEGSLHGRIQVLEHRLLPEVVDALVRGVAPERALLLPD